MDQFMERNSEMRAPSLQVLGKKFDRAIHGCERIWGDHAFERADKSVWRNQMMSGLFDAQMIAIDESSDTALEAAVRNRAVILGQTKELFKDPAFDEAVRRSTNTPSRLKLRIEKIIDLLK